MRKVDYLSNIILSKSQREMFKLSKLDTISTDFIIQNDKNKQYL